VGDIDGDAATALLGRVVNLVVVPELGQVLGGEDLGDGGSEGRLPVVHVTDRTDVAVRLVPLEHLFFVQNAAEQKGEGRNRVPELKITFLTLLIIRL